MTQLRNENLFAFDKSSQVEVLAASGPGFQIELIKSLDDVDTQSVLSISREYPELQHNSQFSPANIRQLFNYPKTFPVLARLNGRPVACIIGVPLEQFNKESWVKCDKHWGDGSTVYTQYELILPRYRRQNYHQVLGKMYINFLSKRGYQYVTGHRQSGSVSALSERVEVVHEFENWQNSYRSYEYFRINIG